MLALGVRYEHTRTDRDEYVTVQWGNIKKESANLFWKDDNVDSALGNRLDKCALPEYNGQDFSDCGSGVQTKLVGGFDFYSIMLFSSNQTE